MAETNAETTKTYQQEKDDERTALVASRQLGLLESLEIRAWKDAEDKPRENSCHLVYTAREYLTRRNDEGERIFAPSDTIESIKSYLGLREGLTLEEAQALFARITNSDSFYNIRTEYERGIERKRAEAEIKAVVGDDASLRRIWSAIPKIIELVGGIFPNTTESRIHRAARHDNHDKCIVLRWNTFTDVIEMSVDAGSYFLMDNMGRFYEQRQRTSDDSPSTGKYAGLSEKEFLRRIAAMSKDNFAHRSRVAERLEKLVKELGGKLE